MINYNRNKHLQHHIEPSFEKYIFFFMINTFFKRTEEIEERNSIIKIITIIVNFRTESVVNILWKN